MEKTETFVAVALANRISANPATPVFVEISGIVPFRLMVAVKKIGLTRPEPFSEP